jgi:hypothetical protein
MMRNLVSVAAEASTLPIRLTRSEAVAAELRRMILSGELPATRRRSDYSGGGANPAALAVTPPSIAKAPPLA